MTYEEIIRGMVGDNKHYENWTEADLVIDEDEFEKEELE